MFLFPSYTTLSCSVPFRAISLSNRFLFLSRYSLREVLADSPFLQFPDEDFLFLFIVSLECVSSLSSAQGMSASAWFPFNQRIFSGLPCPMPRLPLSESRFFYPPSFPYSQTHLLCWRPFERMPTRGLCSSPLSFLKAPFPSPNYLVASRRTLTCVLSAIALYLQPGFSSM